MTHNPAEALRELLDTLKIHKANFYGGMWTERQRKDLMEAIHHGNEALLALTSPAPASAGPVLLDEARAHLAQSDEVISVMPNTTRAIIEGLLAAVSAPTPNESTLITIIADIREKSGVGSKPMLSELADAIAARIKPSASPDVAGVVERLRDWQDYRPMSEFCPAAIPDLLEAATLLESLSAKLQRTIEDGGFREMRQQDIIESLSAEKGQMEAALRECQKALAMMIDPNNIQLTSPLNAYAAAVSAEVRARTALTPKEKT